MRSSSVVLAAVVGLAISGCGSDPCDKADEAIKNVTTQASSCSGIPVPSVTTKAQCEEAIKSCNSVDKEIIRQQFDCLSAVGACVPGKESSFLQSIAACTAPIVTLSSSCQAQFQPQQ